MCRVLLVLLLGLQGARQGEPAARGETAAEKTYTVECTFRNPAYSGSCTVSESVSEKSPPATACGEILSCLNNSQCSKTYCNATTVRGGWTLEKAERQQKGSSAGSGPR